MKKTGMLILSALLLLLSLCAASALAENAEENMDEWTVMFYFCGSDLESKYSYATGNLEEITLVNYPDTLLERMLEPYGAEPPVQPTPGKVNVLIETGGSKEWHAGDELGVDISSDALQRWRYEFHSITDENYEDDSFELMETLPLQSMADPETLSDFIRWGRETCPAKKYALVLWDHGDGARTGLFIDELFENDVMYLYELRQALGDADTHLEAVIIDACMMANIETAWSIKDYAGWMAASEENVPGKGTAVEAWLQQLLAYPEGDGEWLCRCVCDTTLVKYANEESEESRSLLTWSVVDLSKMDTLLESVEEFFRTMDETLRNYPTVANLYVSYLFKAEEYGDGMENMRDFGDVLYNTELIYFFDRSLRARAIQALTDAVDYCVRGPGRSSARGLSFCYPADFSDEELDIYAKNFPLPVYLAYIDAASSWTAPDWVYESVEPLPDIDDIDELQVFIERKIDVTGMPGVVIGKGDVNVDRVYYRLYRLDEETGNVVSLGRTDCTLMPLSNDGGITIAWRAADPMHWPAIDGQLISMELVQTQVSRKLYNVPVIINTMPSLLRCGRTVGYSIDEDEAINEYEIYGVWEGYEANSTLLDRSVMPLAMLVGQEYQLVYPIDAESDRIAFDVSEPLTMYRRLEVEEIPLPAGTYYLEYEVDDLFMRQTTLNRVEVHWDGETMTLPEESSWNDDDWVNLKDFR